MRQSQAEKEEEKHRLYEKEKQTFEELLEKFQNFKTRDSNKTLLNNKEGRLSYNYSSQPVLEPLVLEKVRSEAITKEKEVRLQSSKPIPTDLLSHKDLKLPLKLSGKAKSMINLSVNDKQSSNISNIQHFDDMDEPTFEEKMKSLPHWKYKASFENYMSGITTVTKDVIDEFMKL